YRLCCFWFCYLLLYLLLKKNLKYRRKHLLTKNLCSGLQNCMHSHPVKPKCSKSCLPPTKVCRKSLTDCLFQGAFCKDIFHLSMKKRGRSPESGFFKIIPGIL